MSLTTGHYYAVLMASSLLTFAMAVSIEAQQRKLAEFDIPLLGISATVEPANPVIPKNVASAVRIVIRAGTQQLSVQEAAQFLGQGIKAQAELSGPGLGQTITLPFQEGETGPSDPLLLPIPPLAVAGDYALTNIRLVNATGQPILDVTPRSVNVKVIDQILITSVRTRALTLDEIRQKGIVLDSSDYLAFEFTMAVMLESKTVSWSMPVVFDRQGVPVPLSLLPPSEPPRETVDTPAFPRPTVVPMLLTPAEDFDFSDRNDRFKLPGGGGGIRIPALLVIPGNTGYLKQFFSAQLFVGNGAPVGSGLVLRDIVEPRSSCRREPTVTRTRPTIRSRCPR